MMTSQVGWVALDAVSWKRAGAASELETLLSLGLHLEHRLQQRLRPQVDRGMYHRLCRVLEETALLASRQAGAPYLWLPHPLPAAYLEFTRLYQWTADEVGVFTRGQAEAESAAAVEYSRLRRFPVGRVFYPAGWPVRQQLAIYRGLTTPSLERMEWGPRRGCTAPAENVAEAAELKWQFCASNQHATVIECAVMG